MPAWPMTRFFGKPVASWVSAVISSSGLETTMTTASGACLATFSATSRTILALVSMQVHPAHAGLARQAGGDDDDVGAVDGLVAVAARPSTPDDLGLEALDRPRLVHVQREALGLALDDVGEHDGLEDVVLGQPLRGGGAVEAGADDGDLALPGLHLPWPANLSPGAPRAPGAQRRGQAREHGQREARCRPAGGRRPTGCAPRGTPPDAAGSRAAAAPHPISASPDDDEALPPVAERHQHQARRRRRGSRRAAAAAG